MTEYQTAPQKSDAITRDPENLSAQLDPPAEFPVIFSCKVNGGSAIGCVYRNGVVSIVPDKCDEKRMPQAFSRMAVIEESDYITDVEWEWQVKRCE